MIKETITETFYGYNDVLAQLGGIKSIAGPILTVVTPFFILNFLIGLNAIIQL
jgi:hypothetical protein